MRLGTSEVCDGALFREPSPSQSWVHSNVRFVFETLVFETNMHSSITTFPRSGPLTLVPIEIETYWFVFCILCNAAIWQRKIALLPLFTFSFAFSLLISVIGSRPNFVRNWWRKRQRLKQHENVWCCCQLDELNFNWTSSSCFDFDITTCCFR